MKRGSFTHSHMGALADWGLGERGWLESSKLSHLRNNHFIRSGFTSFEALGAVNEVLHSWRVHGVEKTIARFGPRPDQKLTDPLLDAATWLHHPVYTDEPLDFEDFCSLFCGRLTLPYVEGITVAPSETKSVSKALGDLLDTIMNGWTGSTRERVARLMELYAVDDNARRQRLQSVVLGTDVFTQEELEVELEACSNLVRAARGLPEGGYGPGDLYGELSNPRQRT